ncbi:hypothetical protein PCE1_001742 [Barthelona sp. PCE]
MPGKRKSKVKLTMGKILEDREYFAKGSRALLDHNIFLSWEADIDNSTSILVLNKLNGEGGYINWFTHSFHDRVITEAFEFEVEEEAFIFILSVDLMQHTYISCISLSFSMFVYDKELYKHPIWADSLVSCFNRKYPEVQNPFVVILTEDDSLFQIACPEEVADIKLNKVHFDIELTDVSFTDDYSAFLILDVKGNVHIGNISPDGKESNFSVISTVSNAVCTGPEGTLMITSGLVDVNGVCIVQLPENLVDPQPVYGLPGMFVVDDVLCSVFLKDREFSFTLQNNSTISNVMIHDDVVYVLSDRYYLTSNLSNSETVSDFLDEPFYLNMNQKKPSLSVLLEKDCLDLAFELFDNNIVINTLIEMDKEHLLYTAAFSPDELHQILPLLPHTIVDERISIHDAICLAYGVPEYIKNEELGQFFDQLTREVIEKKTSIEEYQEKIKEKMKTRTIHKGLFLNTPNQNDLKRKASDL